MSVAKRWLGFGPAACSASSVPGNRSMSRRRGAMATELLPGPRDRRTLFGPLPRRSAPEISWPESSPRRPAMPAKSGNRSLRDATPGARAYAVLTMCRALCTIQSGRHCSNMRSGVGTGADANGHRSSMSGAVPLSRGQVGFTDDATLTAAEGFIRLPARDREASSVTRRSLDPPALNYIHETDDRAWQSGPARALALALAPDSASCSTAAGLYADPAGRFQGDQTWPVSCSRVRASDEAAPSTPPFVATADFRPH